MSFSNLGLMRLSQLILCALMVLSSSVGYAEETFKNVWKGTAITTEPVAGTDYVYIKNPGGSGYFHTQNSDFEIGPIQRGWWSAQWKKIQEKDFVRFQNRWKKNLYLNNQNGPIAAGAIQPGWWSARWKSFGVSAAVSSAPPKLISGKQCVYNKGGFALTVEWYNPGTIVFNGGDVKDYSKYTTTGKPVQTDNVTLGYSSCTNMANRVAVARIIGANIANDAITHVAGALSGAATVAAGVMACPATGGLGCKLGIFAAGKVSDIVIAEVSKVIPNGKEIAYIGSPGTVNYVDLYGTVWEPTIANSIPLSKERNALEEGFNSVGNAIASAANSVADSIGEWVTGGKPGPKSISYNNQGVYVGIMDVVYFEDKNINGQIVALPTLKSTDGVTAGITRHINIPENISKNHPIIVNIKGVGTIKYDLMKDNNKVSSSIPSTFTGNICFKSVNSIFDADAKYCHK